MLEIVEKLAGLSPRQFEREAMTRKYIIKVLNKSGVGFRLQNFNVTVPEYTDYYLKADGKNIECMPTCFVSGKIDESFDLISSLDYSYESKGRSNINYNPYCDSISLANYYNSPAIAISRKDAKRIKKAKNIEGFVKVVKIKCISCNILAGKLKNPDNIFFAHYDGFFAGVLDNASGVAVCMSTILSSKEVLKNNLFVFCGSEELSFDKPDYWGKCFRVFENRNRDVLMRAGKIIIVDCVGSGTPEMVTDDKIVPLYFPAKSLGRIMNKTFVVTSAEKKPLELMSVYHSKLDTLKNVRKNDLEKAEKLCLKLCK